MRIKNATISLLLLMCLTASSLLFAAPVLPSPPALEVLPDNLKIEQGSFAWIQCGIVNRSKEDFYVRNPPLRELGNLIVEIKAPKATQFDRLQVPGGWDCVMSEKEPAVRLKPQEKLWGVVQLLWKNKQGDLIFSEAGDYDICWITTAASPSLRSRELRITVLQLDKQLRTEVVKAQDSISHIVLRSGDTKEPKKWKDALAIVDPIEAALPEGGYLRTNIALAKELRAAVETADSAQRAAKLAALLAKCQKRDPAERYVHYSSIWSACKDGKHAELLREVEKLQAESR